MIVIAYSREGYQEFCLPKLSQGDCCLVLQKEYFAQEKDVRLLVQEVGGCRRLGSGEGCRVVDVETGSESPPLRDGACYLGMAWTGWKFSLLAVENGNHEGFFKYDLTGLSEITIGKSASSHICYEAFAYVSRNHALLCRVDGGWELCDISVNGVFVNHRRVTGKCFLRFGDLISIFGLRLLYLGEILAVTAAGGTLVVNERVLRRRIPQMLPSEEGRTLSGQDTCMIRAPRTDYPCVCAECVEIEGPPPKSGEGKRPMFLAVGPALTMMLPMLLGSVLAASEMRERGGSGGMYLYTGAVTSLSSAALASVWALAGSRYEKRRLAREERQRIETYRAYIQSLEEKLSVLQRQEADALERAYPSAGTLLDWYGENGRLWSRNIRHDDMLYCRLGRGERLFHARLSIPRKRFLPNPDPLTEEPERLFQRFSRLWEAPTGVDLMERRLIGLIGVERKKAAWLILAQIAAHTCYTEVTLAVLYPGEEDDWGATRWLPHVWSIGRRFRYVAANKEEASDVCFELGTELRRREEQGELTSVPLPYLVVVLACPDFLEGEPAAKYLLNPKKEHGLTVLYLAKSREELPNQCEFAIACDKGEFRFQEDGIEVRARPDPIASEGMEKFFRRLSAIRIKETEQGGEIPASLTFYELYGVSSARELQAARRWRRNRTYENMRVPVGRKAGGICYLDVHEKYHGPHGLVAGTTGSGKSEMLQAYILSLAVNFRPEDVNFFIIDFKGGGMANLFSGLPHLAGQISNLSGNQIRRAMISIKSENKRRQQLFGRCGVNNIGDYSRMFEEGGAKQPVAHLFIIVDEFAELKREEPEFMRELISVAQVGRSLGVHLILATQKPGGTVDDNIWSNTRFRICLRVQNRQDSSDVLHKPDAAYLTGAGSGYLQVGNDEVYERFQSAWSGAPSRKEQASISAVMINRTGRPCVARLGEGEEAGKGHKVQMEQNAYGEHKRQNEKKDRKDQIQRTQLEEVVEYLAETAREENCQNPFQLWLPALPRQLYLKELPEWKEEGEQSDWHLNAVLGRLDHPAAQAQPTLTADLAVLGHVAVCGGAGSGKSTFLQTLVYSLVHICTPLQLHLYLLDFSSRMLGAFAAMPHTGGIVYDSEPEKLKQFFHFLSHLMEERRTLLGGGSYGQYVRANGWVLPAILIVLDNYASFQEKGGDQYESTLIRLAREGSGCGIFLAVSCNGFGSFGLPTRIADHIKAVYALEMGDSFQYGEIFRGAKPQILPETGVKGRGLANMDGQILEFQTALCLMAKDDYARAASIEEEGKRMWEKYKGASGLPAGILQIPARPMLTQMKAWPGFEEKLKSGGVPMGFCTEDTSLACIDLKTTFCFLIAGNGRTGKTNLLKVLSWSAGFLPGRLHVIELGERELKPWADLIKAEYIGKSAELFRFFLDLTPELRARNEQKKELLGKGLLEEELYDAMGDREPWFIFIADLAEFMRAVYHPEPGVGAMAPFVEMMVQKGRYHRIFFLAAAGLEQLPELVAYPAYAYMAAAREGILLGGNPAGQRLFSFPDIPYARQSKPLKPGIGLLPAEPEEGGTKQVIIPLARLTKEYNRDNETRREGYHGGMAPEETID